MHIRITLIDEPDLPSEMLYEVTNNGDVSRIVEIDHDGSIFWDDVSAYQDKSEMVGKNSLVEGSFPPKADWPPNAYDTISDDEFQKLYERAVNYGKRRTRANV